MKVGYVHKDSTTDENIRKEFSDVIYPTMVIRSQAETIELQEKEIERLNNKNEELLTLYTTEREVKDYYKNIINELEKDINKRIERYDVDETINGIVTGTLKYVLDKLQELKGDDKE